MTEKPRTETKAQSNWADVAFKNLARVKGRKIGVIGMARSGLASASLAKALGAEVFVSEFADQSQRSSEIGTLEKAGIAYEAGGHTDALLACDFVIVSPGVSSSSDIIKSLQEAGTPIFAELEFASWFTQGRIIAITGANGKTTTATMIDQILKHGSYTSHLCGNIGLPLSSIVSEINRNDVAVVEVSSYQLEFVDEFAPQVATILNVTPDHLSRHGSFKEYRLAKLRITEAQDENQTLLLNIDDSGLDAQTIQTSAKRMFFGSEKTLNGAAVDSSRKIVFQRGDALFCGIDGVDIKLIENNQLQVPGAHNIENAMAAAASCLAFGVSLDAIREGLTSFTGVEHRIEHVATIGGVKWINDSKATNLAATICALDAIDAPAHLILGGRGKGEDFAELQGKVSEKVRSIVALGETKEEIFAILGKVVPVQFATTLQEATLHLAEAAKEGEVVLLSPGCASFDMFEDFEARGCAFKEAVHALEGEEANV